MPLRQESSASQEDEAFDQHAAPDCVECTKRLLSLVGHDFVKFDQCRLGQLVENSATISSDLEIQCWMD